jgi:Ca-activated chloride channel family protein
MIKFGAYSYFMMFLLLVPLVLFYVLTFYWKKRLLRKFGNMEILGKLISSSGPFLQYFKACLIILAFIFMVVAIAQPRWGAKLEMIKRKGLDVMIVLDVSTSMLAQDIKPSRLERAKHEISKFIQKLSSDRVGLIAFAGDAFVHCPLTLDYSAARMFLQHMDPSLIPTQGTNISEALRKAIKAFDQKERKYKVMVIITDGESHAGDPVSWAEKAAEEGIIIFTVGVGSPKGVPIPIKSRDDSKVYKKDRKGNIVMTKVDEVTLEKIAWATDGKYFHATGSGVELDRIYEEINEMEKKELESRKISQYEERFQWFLIWAFIFVVLEFFTPERWKARKKWEGRFA